MSVTTETLRIVNEVVYKGKGEAQKLDGDLKTTSNKVKKLNVDWAQMAAGLGIVGGAAAGLGSAYVKLYQVMGEGAQVQATQLTFENLAMSIDSTSDAMLGDLREATGGMISDMGLMQAANQFTAMGLANTSTEAAKLAEIGSTLGAAFRGDAAAGMDEFALLLANQSIPRLDTFGISAGAVRTRIAELQAEFPDMNREAAFMAAVMEEAEATMGKLGDSSGSAATQMAILEASFENAKKESALLVTEGLLPTLTAMANLVTTANDATGSMDGFSDGMVTGIRVAFQPGVETLEKIDHTLTVLGANPWWVWFTGGINGAKEAIAETEAAMEKYEFDQRRFTAGATQATGAVEEQNEVVADAAPLYEHLRRTVALAQHEYEGLDSTVYGTAQTIEDGGEIVEEVTEVMYSYTDAINASAEAARLAREAEAMRVAELGDYATSVQLAADNTFNANDAIWRQIDALNASPEATIAAGLALGIYTEKQAEARIEAVLLEIELQKVVDAIEDGRLTADQGVEAFVDLATGVHETAVEAILAHDNFLLTSTAIEDAEAAALQMANESLPGLATMLFNLRGDAQGFADALNAIPTSIVVDILINQSGQYTPPPLPGPSGTASATGNVFPHGGDSIVGEYGPEFVRLPAGAQVISTNRTAQTISNSTTINGASRRGEQVLLQHLRRLSRPATMTG